MQLLAGLRVAQIDDGLAAAVCGRLFADIGADVSCIGPDDATPLAHHLNHGKTIVSGEAEAREAVAAADLIICEGGPRDLRARRCDPDALRRINGSAALVYISTFGLTGPAANHPASDLT